MGVRVPPSAPVEIRRRSVNLGAFLYFDWCTSGTRTGEGADEQEEKRDFRSASARSRAAKADGVDRRGSLRSSPPFGTMKRPGSDGEIHRSFIVSWCSAGTRTRARRRPNREDKPDFRRASGGGAGREGEGENAGASSVESPLRHHRNSQRESGQAPGSLFP